MESGADIPNYVVDTLHANFQKCLVTEARISETKLLTCRQRLDPVGIGYIMRGEVPWPYAWNFCWGCLS